MKTLTQIMETGIKLGHTVKKHSPAILTVAGTVGVVGTSYLAYRSAKKLDTILAEHESRVERGEELTKVEIVKDVASAVALPVAVGTLSIAAIVGSFFIQNGRISLLTTSLSTALVNSRKYRAKVKELLGEEKAKEIEQAFIEETVTSKNENGDIIRPEDIRISKLTGVYYELSSEYYRDDHHYNVASLENKKQKIEHILNTKGYILLNQVYDIIGFKRTKIGATTGWTCSNPVGFDWNVINFLNDEEHYEPSIWISWNQPAYIYDEVEFEGRYAF